MTTVENMRSAIAHVIEERRTTAARREYDWKVSVTAAATAAMTFKGVPVTGTAETYRAAVLIALNALSETYNDTDGEYTNGRSEIGSIIGRIQRLP